MKAFLILTIAILGFSYANQSIIHTLKENMEDTPYINSMVEMLELSLMQNSKVEQVVGLLSDILGGLRTDQSTEDMEHSNRMSQWEKTIQNLENNLESLSSENQKNNRQLGVYSEDVVTLSSAVTTLSKQLNLLNTKEQSLRETRANENAVYLRRQQTNAKVLAAVEQLVTRLQQALHEKQNPSSFLQIINDFKKELGERNPIVLMVQITLDFDEDTIRSVIEKLEGIAQAIKEQGPQDQQNEQNAEQNFTVMMQENSQMRQSMQTELDSKQNMQKTRQSDIVVCKRKQEEINDDLVLTQQLLQDNRINRESYDSSYQARKMKRGTEIQAVELALNLIQTNAEQLE